MIALLLNLDENVNVFVFYSALIFIERIEGKISPALVKVFLQKVNSLKHTISFIFGQFVDKKRNTPGASTCFTHFHPI